MGIGVIGKENLGGKETGGRGQAREQFQGETSLGLSPRSPAESSCVSHRDLCTLGRSAIGPPKGVGWWDLSP